MKTCVISALILINTVLAGAVTYYVSPGNDIPAAVHKLAPGDTLIFRDGTYNTTLNIDMSGSPYHPITLRAENDGKAVFEGNYARTPLVIYRDPHHIVVEGIRFQNSNANVLHIEGSSITLRRVSAYNASGNNCHVISVSYTHDVYLEDCAASGRGRNLFLLFNSYNLTMRRCWGWWMQELPGGPECNGQYYGSYNCLGENCINVMDPNPVTSSDQDAWNYWSADYNAYSCINNYFINSVFYNYGFYAGIIMQHDSSKQQYNNGVINTVLLRKENYADDVYIDQYGGIDFHCENLTSVGWRIRQYNHPDFGIQGESVQMTVKNCSITDSGIAFENQNIGTGSVLDHTYNNIYNVGTPYVNFSQGTGEIQVDPQYDTAKYGKGAYLLGSAKLKGKGEGGANIGAKVLFRTFNGEVTQEPLWPWPMEDRIQRETFEIFGKRLSVTWESSGTATGGLWKTLDGVYDIIPEKVEMKSELAILNANGVSRLEAKVIDTNGFIVTGSTAFITFSVIPGNGSIIGANPARVSSGTAYVTFRAGAHPGIATITAMSAGLAQGSVSINLLANSSPTASGNLKCNGNVNPSGVTGFNPVLSWSFNDYDAASGDTQGAYRLLVADSLAVLDNNIGNRLDTNRVNSSISSAVYSGLPLQANSQYWWKVMSWDSLGFAGPYSPGGTFIMADINPRAYPDGIARTIPGRIEAEDYDTGGEGIAYHDTTPINDGGTYRIGATEGVDVQGCSEGGFNTGWTVSGEWIEYSVNVLNAGVYRVELRVSNYGAGNNLRVSFGGSDKTGTMSIPATGGSQSWQTISRPGVNLSAGKQIMRLSFDSGGGSGGNINYINVVAENVPPVISVISPNGSEIFYNGSQQVITWTSLNVTGNVSIDLTTDSGSSWSSLVPDISNTGSRQITFPSFFSSACRVRVRSVSGTVSDSSDNNFTISSGAITMPQISLSAMKLSFGELKMGSVSQPQNLTITNNRGGVLTGTITTDKNWISIGQTSFVIASGDHQSLSVIVDNTLLSQRTGNASGEITITSNGNNGAQVINTISVEFTATCVLVKPNPVQLSSPLAGEGGGEGGITFFGDGIVLGKTEIKIYTLSGELIAVLPTHAGMISTLEKSAGAGTDGEITWQPSNLSPGIYVYVYESPKEKGVGKFTVVR